MVRHGILIWTTAGLLLAGLCPFALWGATSPVQGTLSPSPVGSVQSTDPTTGKKPMSVKTTSPITLTVVYNNIPHDARLKTAWGFACLVETSKDTLLFDTGGDGHILLDNMDILGVDPRQIDAVALSHIHGDHTGGLGAILALNDHLDVYVPISFPLRFKRDVSQHARMIEVDGPVELLNGIRTTGEMGTSIREQALLVETDEGVIMVTGCAHPGIVSMAERAAEFGDVYLVMGGFHLSGKSETQIEAIIDQFSHLGVQKVGPSHCTGDLAIRLSEEAYGDDFVESGAGAVIRIGEP